MEVSIFDLQYSDQDILDFQEGSQRILKRGFLTNDLFVNEFEESFAQWIKAPAATAVSNGTSALEIDFDLLM